MSGRWHPLVVLVTALCICVQGLGGPGVSLCLGCEHGGLAGVNVGCCHADEPELDPCCGDEHGPRGAVEEPEQGCTDVSLTSVPLVTIERAAPAGVLATVWVWAAAAWSADEAGAGGPIRGAGIDPSPPRRGHAARTAVLLI